MGHERSLDLVRDLFRRRRFSVAPPLVSDWLALVGDDSGTEVLPGVKGIGAKGATALLEEHGTIAAALASLDTERSGA